MARERARERERGAAVVLAACHRHPQVRCSKGAQSTAAIDPPYMFHPSSFTATPGAMVSDPSLRLCECALQHNGYESGGFFRVVTDPHGVETTTPTDWLLIGWGPWSQRHPRRIRFHPRIRNPSIHLQLQQTGHENGGLPGRYLPARCGNPNPTR